MRKNSQHTKLFSVTEHLLEEKKKQDDMKNFQDLNEKKYRKKKLKKMI